MTEDKAEKVPQSIKGPGIKKGLVIVNTGDGKGKTTAALGVLFRAWGRGMKVRMFQFIKNSGSRYGEQRAAEKIGIPILSLGDGRSCPHKTRWGSGASLATTSPHPAEPETTSWGTPECSARRVTASVATPGDRGGAPCRKLF